MCGPCWISVPRDQHVLTVWVTQHVPVSLLQCLYGLRRPVLPPQSLPVTGCCWPTSLYDGKKLLKSWESGTERRDESRWWRWRRPQRVCGVSQLWHEWCQKLLLPSWTESLLKCYKFWRMLSCLLLWGCFLYFHAATFLKENIWIKQSKKIFSVDLGKANGRYVYSKKCCSFCSTKCNTTIK